MSKTFNLYCDESTHLENDGKPYLLIGSVTSPYNQVKRHVQRIKELKVKHNFYAEIKWVNLSTSKYQFYKELIDYFFDSDLVFRCVVVEKEQVKNEAFGQDFDTFYYKMYYQLLNHKINSLYAYNVYLDIKDTLSSYKVNKLREILNTKFGVFRNVQNIRSEESLLMQLADVLIGAISYNLNEEDQHVRAKKQLIQRIQTNSGQTLTKSSTKAEPKVNLFFIELS